MTDVTQILNAIEQGDPRVAEQLLPLVYDEFAIRCVVRRPAASVSAEGRKALHELASGRHRWLLL
jgi:hypothetical protein